MFPEELVRQAERLLDRLRAESVTLATAESCTGGLLSGLLTGIAGASDVLERGWVTYSNEAKVEELGVEPGLIAAHGAVSAEVARAMAVGALERSSADVAAAVTGIAGPGGGTAGKPVGLVHLAALRRGGSPRHHELRLGNIGRQQVRLQSLAAALALIETVL